MIITEKNLSAVAEKLEKLGYTGMDASIECCLCEGYTMALIPEKWDKTTEVYFLKTVRAEYGLVLSSFNCSFDDLDWIDTGVLEYAELPMDYTPSDVHDFMSFVHSVGQYYGIENLSPDEWYLEDLKKTVNRLENGWEVSYKSSRHTVATVYDYHSGFCNVLYFGEKTTVAGLMEKLAIAGYYSQELLDYVNGDINVIY